MGTLNLGSGGTLISDKWENSDSTENYKCRAWVNFNGTGTVAIRASGNVSSITDNGTGDYTVNFTTAMPDANYSVTFGGNNTAASNHGYLTLHTNAGALASGSMRCQGVNGSNAAIDLTTCTVAIFR